MLILNLCIIQFALRKGTKMNRTIEHYELRIDRLKKKDPVANEKLIKKAKRNLEKCRIEN